MIQNYKPLDHIKVSQEAVEKQEGMILDHFQKHAYFHLSERLSRLRILEMRYSAESFGIETEKITQQLSDFLAYQEALFNLMTNGKIIPVYVSNYSSSNFYGANSIVISYEERQDNDDNLRYN
ncbi:hypothetical protein QW71_32595 [Paenibacillus sp. IHB B 3415]|uniref:hypothetical protein n=1 Tax=Paenibacillus sp. IHB B 3415 TaxID=867080 RepID=UPI00057461E6|nr:hypothetical protein [Paenibacillus sp. IHB B 3415]KHL91839.1 hypothetical protein QW71_32595 [Paenibacillus sp. IHB B 3415]